MILLADESVDRPIVLRLREEGFVVDYVTELSPGIADEDVLRLANSRGAFLITMDSDFGELVFRLRQVSIGVMLLRLAGLSNPAKADLTVQVFRKHAAELPGTFSVVSPGQVRIRRLS